MFRKDRVGDGFVSPFLYHATSKDIAGLSLKPSLNFTCDKKEKSRFVFASRDIKMAYAYALKVDAADGETYTHGIFMLFGVPIIILSNKSSYLRDLESLDLSIIKVPGQYFEQVSDTFEYVARVDVPIDICEVNKVTIEEALCIGKVQMLFLEDGFSVSKWNELFVDNVGGGEDMVARMIDNAVHDGLICHYNREILGCADNVVAVDFASGGLSMLEWGMDLSV